MATKSPSNIGVRNNPTLRLLAVSFEEVRASLKTRGYNIGTDPALLQTVSDALIVKAKKGESRKDVLTKHALVKAWSHIWQTEEVRAEQLDKLREPFKKQPS